MNPTPVVQAALFLVLALALAFPACQATDLRHEPLERDYWVISPSRDGKEAADGPAPARALDVRPFHITPAAAGRELVYRISDREYASDYYNLLLYDPARMLAASAREWLAGAGLFHRVLPPGSTMSPDWVLETSVVRMYGDYRQSGNGPAAVVRARFFLLEEGGRGRHVVWQDVLSSRVPLEGEGAAGLVAGLDQAWAEVLAGVESGIRGFARKRYDK
jgi:ABC-type uncharacterized transport system auxiliary subunit